MIDLLYSYRRRKAKLSEVKNHILEYVAAIKELTGLTFYDTYLSSYNFDTGSIDELIALVRPELRDIQYRCTVQRNGVNSATGKSIGEISKIVLSDFNANPSTHGGEYGLYIWNYAKWIFSAFDDIYDCIVVNGCVSDIEYVGYRTKQYINALGLTKNPKRFGSPVDRNAHPICFYNGAFTLSSPPMTRAAHSKQFIDNVYKFFGYTTFYEVNIGKTLFTRAVDFEKKLKTLIPIDTYMKETDQIKTYQDINASFVYDLLVAVYIKRLTSLVIDVESVFNSFPTIDGSKCTYDDNFLSKLVVQSDTFSLPELITLVY